MLGRALVAVVRWLRDGLVLVLSGPGMTERQRAWRRPRD